MSQEKNNRKKLRKLGRIGNSNICIFCGSINKQLEEDHYPPKSWFNKRQWPKGFSFPACERCNKISREADRVVGMMIKMSTNDYVEDSIESINLWGGFSSHNEVGKYIKAYRWQYSIESNIEIRDGKAIYCESWKTKLEIDVQDETLKYLSLVCLKLCCALYYKETGKIVPRKTNFRWMPFFKGNDYEGLPTFVKELFNIKVKVKTAIDEGHQFSYYSNIQANGELAMFFCDFRNSLGLYIVMCSDAKFLAEAEKDCGFPVWKLHPSFEEGLQPES